MKKKWVWVTLMMFSKMVSRNSNSAFWSNSFPWIILICFRNVDFPLSPAPSSKIFTNRRIERLSRASIASISLLRRFASRSWCGSRVSRVRSLLLPLSWLASAGSKHRLRVRTTPAIVSNYANHQRLILEITWHETFWKVSKRQVNLKMWTKCPIQHMPKKTQKVNERKGNWDFSIRV